MSRRTNKNICLYCFGTLSAERQCGTCLKQADDSPAPLHHLPVRTVLCDRYLIGKALGEGGFGITYFAWDTATGEPAAIKEYYPTSYVTRVPKSNQVIINAKSNSAASGRGLRRFIDEARTLSKLKKLSGVVTVQNHFSANGTAYIIMEYLDGTSLKKHLARKEKLTVAETLKIMRPIIESMAQMHELGIVHRDISPDNIILTKKKAVKLIDFGAAKQSNLDGKTLSIVLKQGFAPEEQYRSHGEQGPWTDIYALGVTIYYAITGKMPPESIQRMYKDNIIKPSELGVDITEQQERTLMKALTVNAKYRYRDCNQMLRGLYGNSVMSETKTEESTIKDDKHSRNKPITKPVPKKTAENNAPVKKETNKSPAKSAKNSQKKSAKTADDSKGKPGFFGRLFGKKEK